MSLAGLKRRARKFIKLYIYHISRFYYYYWLAILSVHINILGFAGCMKEVAMDRKLQEWVTWSEVVSNPNVYLDGCPVNTITQETCQHGFTTVIEENINDTFTYDYDLNPFTGLYAKTLILSGR